MNTAEFATVIVENASSSLLESLEGLEAEDVWMQVAPDANPIAWIVGHLASHLDALQSAVSGQPRLLEKARRELFRPGIKISEVLPHLPSFSDTVEGFLQAREAALAALSSATEEVLNKQAGGRFLKENVLDSSKRVALHLSLHLGQMLLVRKLLGKPCARGFFRRLEPQHRREAMDGWNNWWAQNKSTFDANPHAAAKGN